MFVNLDDGTKASSTTIGALAHEGIARLLARGLEPTPHDVTHLVCELVVQFPQIEGRAHRQKLTASISSYFWHLLPPARFIFHGAEVELGTGRPDLLWTDMHGAILIDEVKTGNHQALRTSETSRQVDRYREIANSAWGNQFLGVRLLSTSAPRKSLFIHVDGSCMPLSGTPFHGGLS